MSDSIVEEEQSIYDLLETYFTQNAEKWSKKEQARLRKKFCRYYPCEPKRYKEPVLGKNTLISGKNQFARRRNRYTAARLLVALGIPASVFGLKDLLPESGKDKNGENSRLVFLPITNRTDCSQEYANINIAYIQKTTDSLRMHDYLGKGSLYEPEKSLKKLNYLAAHHNKIFPCIVEQLRRYEQMIYIRVLGLPMGIEKASGPNLSKKHWEMKLQALKYCSLQLFDHICQCLKEFEVEGASIQRVLFAVAPASRTHQFGIFDSRYIYNEYYRIDKTGTAKPSFLTINDVDKSKDIKTLLTIYNKEVATLSETANLYLYLNELGELLEAYKKKWSAESPVDMDEKNLLNRKINTYNECKRTEQAIVLPL